VGKKILSGKFSGSMGRDYREKSILVEIRERRNGEEGALTLRIRGRVRSLF